MATVTTEIEASSSVPASKLFNVFIDFDTLAPKVDPKKYKSVSIIEGDGGVGSIRSITFNDGVPYTSSKSKIDTIDKTNLSFVWTVFGGDVLLGVLDSITHSVSFTPSAEGGTIFKHVVVFKCKGDAKLSEETINQDKETFKNTFKALEAYVIAHPEAY